MQDTERSHSDAVFEVINPQGPSPVLLVCEHASAHIPDAFDGLGLDATARQSHIAWDPGALGVARTMSDHLDAPLIASRVSRLVYDCNRPPEAPAAMPLRSEVYDIPGNTDLTQDQKAERVAAYYTPFHDAIAQRMRQQPTAYLVTVHSFTPVYNGAPRSVEIGVLHDTDTALADAMLDTGATFLGQIIRRNDPYGPKDGVTHTLQKHGVASGIANVMLEVRNDLIATPESQHAMGLQLAHWVMAATAQVAEAAACRA